MNSFDLLDSIGNIDPKYITEADNIQKPKSNIKKFYRFYLAAAALLLMVVAGTVFTLQRPKPVANKAVQKDEGQIETFAVEGTFPYMIMIDGSLYSSTDEPYNEEIPEGAPIKVLSYTDGTPEEDGQQNFDETSTSLYVIIDETHVAVQIDGSYTIFEKTEE